MAKPQWQSIRDEKLISVADHTPQNWLLPASSLPDPSQRDITSIPETCGLLSPREIEITTHGTTHTLLNAFQNRQYTAAEVTTAYSKVHSPLKCQCIEFALTVVPIASSYIESVDKLHHRAPLCQCFPSCSRS